MAAADPDSVCAAAHSGLFECAAAVDSVGGAAGAHLPLSVCDSKGYAIADVPQDYKQN